MSAEIKVCLEIIQDEIKKLSAFDVDNVIKEFAEMNNCNINEHDYLKIQLITELVITEQERYGLAGKTVN